MDFGYGFGEIFDNVPQDMLMSLVHNIISDGVTESLIRKYLKAGVMIQGNLKRKAVTGKTCELL